MYILIANQALLKIQIIEVHISRYFYNASEFSGFYGALTLPNPVFLAACSVYFLWSQVTAAIQ